MDTLLIISLIIAILSALIMFWDIYKNKKFKRITMTVLAIVSILLCFVYTANSVMSI